MFFKHVMIGFMILGVVGWMYGDHVFYFQGNMMMRMQYPLPAYEAYERIVLNYPDSQYIDEAKIMMEQLRNRSRELQTMLEKKEAKMRKVEEERREKEAFH